MYTHRIKNIYNIYNIKYLYDIHRWWGWCIRPWLSFSYLLVSFNSQIKKQNYSTLIMIDNIWGKERFFRLFLAKLLLSKCAHYSFKYLNQMVRPCHLIQMMNWELLLWWHVRIIVHHEQQHWTYSNDCFGYQAKAVCSGVYYGVQNHPILPFLLLQSLQEICNALHHIIRHKVLLLRLITVLVNLCLFKGRDAC